DGPVCVTARSPWARTNVLPDAVLLDGSSDGGVSVRVAVGARIVPLGTSGSMYNCRAMFASPPVSIPAGSVKLIRPDVPYAITGSVGNPLLLVIKLNCSLAGISKLRVAPSP